MRFPVLLPTLVVVALSGMAAAAPADLSGSWHLNLAKSRWGTVNKPLSVVIRIDHHDPQIHYYGTVQYANEDVRDFAFSGALDGKPYSVSRSFGDGTITLRRIDSWTVESTIRSNDGQYTETAQTTVTRDGRTLVRRMSVRGPDGRKAWTETYDRR